MLSPFVVNPPHFESDLLQTHGKRRMHTTGKKMLLSHRPFHYCRTARWQNSRGEQSVFSITNGYSFSPYHNMARTATLETNYFTSMFFLKLWYCRMWLFTYYFFSITYNLKEFFQSITWQLIRLSTCIKSHDLLII